MLISVQPHHTQNCSPTPLSQNYPNPNYTRQCKTDIENIVQLNYTLIPIIIPLPLTEQLNTLKLPTLQEKNECSVSVLIFRRTLLGYYAEGMHANF